MPVIYLAFLLLTQYSSSADDNSPIPAQISSYLRRFGYVSGTGSAQRSKTVLVTALRRLQSFAGLSPTGLLDQSTLALIASKRCALPDTIPTENDRRQHRNRRFVHQGLKWTNTNLTYRVVNGASTVNKANVRRIMYDALKTWQEVSAFSFTETADPQADIQIWFARGSHGDSYPFDGPDIILAHAFFPSAGTGGDIHFDDDERWTARIPVDPYAREVSLLAVTIHEIGHSLGLGHSNVVDSLMYPYYHYVTKPTHSRPKLHYDDIVAIQSLYGRGDRSKPSRAPPTTTTSSSDGTRPSDPCAVALDALSLVRRQTFLFKGKWLWRVDSQGRLRDTQPVLVRRFWSQLPANLSRIDAVYEQTDRDRLVFFIGREQYVFSGQHLLPGYPKRLTDIGLPQSMSTVRLAFVWEYNRKIYIFGDDQYWRFDARFDHVELDYPRKIKQNWHGIPTNVQAAFTDHQNRTLFFSDDHLVYRFEGQLMKVSRGYPKSGAAFWPHCHQQEHGHMALSRNAPTLSLLPSLICLIFIHLFFQN